MRLSESVIFGNFSKNCLHVSFFQRKVLSWFHYWLKWLLICFKEGWFHLSPSYSELSGAPLIFIFLLITQILTPGFRNHESKFIWFVKQRKFYENFSQIISKWHSHFTVMYMFFVRFNVVRIGRKSKVASNRENRQFTMCTFILTSNTHVTF